MAKFFTLMTLSEGSIYIVDYTMDNQWVKIPEKQSKAQKMQSKNINCQMFPLGRVAVEQFLKLSSLDAIGHQSITEQGKLSPGARNRRAGLPICALLELAVLNKRVKTRESTQKNKKAARVGLFCNVC